MFSRKLLAAIALMAIGLSGCSTRSIESEARTAMDLHSDAHFQALEFSEDLASILRTKEGDLSPGYRYTGKTSKVLWKAKTFTSSGIMRGDRLEQRILAVTEKGNYFWVNYSFEVEAPKEPIFGLFSTTKPCVEHSCGTMSGYATTKQKAMRFFFYSEQFSPELFESIFEEKAPVRWVDA